MEIQSPFTKPVHTMEIQAGSHNGDTSRFTQWRSKPIHTMEIQAGSHNRGSRRFTQWRSKLIHKNSVGIPLQITWPLSSFQLYLQQKAYV